MSIPALSIYLSRLPIEFFYWWYSHGTINLYNILVYIFKAVAHLFSFKELFTTFFKPWKNEYREGLVRTAIFIGAFFKSILIVFDLFIFTILIILETAVFIIWLLLPILPVILLYGAFFS